MSAPPSSCLVRSWPSHFLRHQWFCGNRRVRRATAHRKIVADHHHRAAIDLGAAEHAVRRCQLLEFALFVVFTDAGDGADLVEAAPVRQLVDALTNGEPALVTLSLDLVNASHLAREGFAPREVVELRLPDHPHPPSLSYYYCAPARRSIFAPAGWQKCH